MINISIFTLCKTNGVSHTIGSHGNQLKHCSIIEQDGNFDHIEPSENPFKLRIWLNPALVHIYTKHKLFIVTSGYFI